ncbi:MAG: efflux transporter outer membrane subunit [Pirellulaceae bacterium]|nr:efflux transporter outer membrane subunit [Planctomycetales bacterium]
MGTQYAKPRMLIVGIAVVGTAIAAGCRVGPDPFRPASQVQPNYRHLETSGVHEGGEDLDGWWVGFNDPVLNDLIHQAVAQNLGLREACLRIVQARATRCVAKADGLPQFDTDASYTFQKISTTGGQFSIFRPDGSAVNIKSTFDQWAMGLNGAWEIDVFGRIFRNIQAADADICATVWDYRDTMVLLLSDVASNYVDARTFQRRLEIAHRNLEAQQKILELTQKRFDAGVISELDVAQAKANVASTQADIPTLEIGYQLAVNRLSTLLGNTPGYVDNFMINPMPIPIPPTEIAIGIPADLLRRRPDVRSIEQQLMAQTARVGVATTDLYPRFSIIGTFGYSSRLFDDLLTTRAIAANVGPNVQWNILNFGRYKCNIQAQEAFQCQLVARYQAAVLQAAEEVDNALVSYDREKQRRGSLAEAVTAFERAVDLSEQQYTQGKVSFQSVLDSQRSLLQSENLLAISEGNVVSNLIDLYKALGGGWNHPHAFAGDVAYDQTLQYAPSVELERLPPAEGNADNANNGGDASKKSAAEDGDSEADASDTDSSDTNAEPSGNPTAPNDSNSDENAPDDKKPGDSPSDRDLSMWRYN